MSTTIMIVQLLICTTIFVPPYCSGFKNRRIQDMYEQGICYINLSFYDDIFKTNRLQWLHGFA